MRWLSMRGLSETEYNRKSKTEYNREVRKLEKVLLFIKTNKFRGLSGSTDDEFAEVEKHLENIISWVKE